MKRTDAQNAYNQWIQQQIHMSYTEIAKELGTTKTEVKTTYNRALRKLRRWIERPVNEV